MQLVDQNSGCRRNNLLFCRTSENYRYIRCYPYLTSFLVNSPTLSSCSNSGILSSIRCWTISAMLTSQLLKVPVGLLNYSYYINLNRNVVLRFAMGRYISPTHVRSWCGSCDSLPFPVPSTFRSVGKHDPEHRWTRQTKLSHANYLYADVLTSITKSSSVLMPWKHTLTCITSTH